MMHFSTLDRVVEDAVDEGKPFLDLPWYADAHVRKRRRGHAQSIDIIPACNTFPESDLKVLIWAGIRSSSKKIYPY